MILVRKHRSILPTNSDAKHHRRLEWPPKRGPGRCVDAVTWCRPGVVGWTEAGGQGGCRRVVGRAPEYRYALRWTGGRNGSRRGALGFYRNRFPLRRRNGLTAKCAREAAQGRRCAAMPCLAAGNPPAEGPSRWVGANKPCTPPTHTIPPRLIGASGISTSRLMIVATVIRIRWRQGWSSSRVY